MEEVLEHLRRPPSRGWLQTVTGRSGNSVKFAIGTQQGLIYVVSESGQMRRKSNVVNVADQRVQRPLTRVSELMQGGNVEQVVIEVAAQASLYLMYCHRSVAELTASAKLILLGSSATVVFSEMERDTCRGSHPRAQQLCKACKPRRRYPLLNGDHLLLLTGHYGVRVSASRPVLYCRSSNPVMNGRSRVMAKIKSRDRATSDRFVPLESIIPSDQDKENTLTCFRT